VPEEINLDVFNADPITEDVSDEATEAAPKTHAPAVHALDTAAESQADLSAEMKAKTKPTAIGRASAPLSVARFFHSS